MVRRLRDSRPHLDESAVAYGPEKQNGYTSPL
jgi:hypothetical protein